MSLACLLYPDKYEKDELADAVERLFSESAQYWEPQRADWKSNEKRVLADFWQQGGDSQLLLSFPEITSVIRRHSGMMTERIPKVVAYPASPQTSMEDAELMTLVFQSLFLSQNWDVVLRKLVEDALIYSVGFVEIGWSKEKGLPTLVNVSPWDIYAEPACKSLADATWVIKRFSLYGFEVVDRYGIEPTDLVNLEHIAVVEEVSHARSKVPKRYPQSVTDSEGTHSLVYTESEPETLKLYETEKEEEEGIKYSKTIGELLERRYRLYECWVKDTSGFYWSYVTSRNFLVSGPNKEGKHCRWHDYRWWERPVASLYGVSLVKLLASLQRLLNTLGSGAALNLEKTMDPIEVMEISVAEAQRNDLALPGQRLLTPDGAINGVRWLEPPRLPPELFELMKMALEATNRVTGVDPLGLRDIQIRRQSATEVEAFSERQHNAILQDARLLEHALERIATAVMCLFAELQTEPVSIPAATYVYSREKIELEANRFWAGPQVIPLERAGAAFEEGLSGTPMEFVAQVEVGSTMPTTRQARENLGLQLYDRQIIDAETLLIDFLDLPQGGVILQRMQQKQVDIMRQVRQPQAGEAEGAQAS